MLAREGGLLTLTTNNKILFYNTHIHVRAHACMHKHTSKGIHIVQTNQLGGHAITNSYSKTQHH